MKKGERLKGGFTIIEVVLVLAVAGLIFAMAFIAVPALQRSQRDNTRRDDMTKFVTEVKRYQTSNRGNLPGTGDTLPKRITLPTTKVAANTWAGFYYSYLGDKFRDPNGDNYQLYVIKCDTTDKKLADSDCDKGVTDAITAIKSSPFGGGTYAYTMLVVAQGKCVGDEIKKSSSPRNLAVLYRLEGSGAYCYGT